MPDRVRATSVSLSADAVGKGFSVQVAGLNHAFGEGESRKQVLFDNRLDVRPGEIVIMTGPSGSGKTTLLTLIGTLRSVQEGSLKVLCNELFQMPAAKIVQLRKKIGFIFQAHNLFESLTAFQNVKMATQLAGIAEETAAPRIEELLTRLGLGHRIHYKPKSLSGGQKQRVAIARGLVHMPQLILADEPTAALDEKSGREVVTMFQEMARESGRTIIMVTHDNRILDVADRIVNMVDGHISSNVLVQESARICDQLKNISLFKELTPTTLAQVADYMEIQQFAPGDTIIREGDEAKEFFVIRDGRVDVSTQKQGSVNQLDTGAFFGEVALMTDKPRNATITAIEPTTCYVLSRDEFQAVIDKSASFEEELRKTLFARQ
ncbi:MAG: ATP-binding cassette domain-containing protein [Planctomycetales bacterium]|nr:ATP-binding cassette domain-containing protein [Planctomycetales bacterium]